MGSNIRKVLKEDKNKKKPRKWEKMKGLVAPISPFLFTFIFVLMAWHFLYAKNADTMYFMQDRGWWNSTSLFWEECTRVPGGWLSWAGAYLTQFFYYPALGSAMLIAIWIVTFLLAKWSFKVPNEWSFLLFIPMAALLCSDIQLGYWVYILKDIDYVFYHPLGLLAALILSLPFWQYLPVSEKIKHWIASAWIPVVAALFYYPLGIYALLAAAIVAVRLLSQKNFVGLAVVVFTIWLVPKIETSGTTLMRPDQRWLYGFHKFELDDLRDYSLEIPFYVALITPLFFPFIKMIRKTRLFFSSPS